MKLRLTYGNGYVVQPDSKNLSNWRVGREVGGTTRWLEQSGTREWAVEEVKHRLEPKPPPLLTARLPNDDDTLDRRQEEFRMCLDENWLATP